MTSMKQKGGKRGGKCPVRSWCVVPAQGRPLNPVSLSVAAWASFCWQSLRCWLCLRACVQRGKTGLWKNCMDCLAFSVGVKSPSWLPRLNWIVPMAVQFHCAENVANIFTPLPPSCLSSFHSFLSPSSVFLKNMLHAPHWVAIIPPSQADPRQEVPGMWCQSTWQRNPSIRVMGWVGASWPFYFGCPRLFPNHHPAGLALWRTRGCLCWKLQS